MSDVTAASSRRLPWPALLALFAAAFTAVMTELLPAGLLPGIAGALGVPEGRAGFLVTAYAVASFVSAVPVTALLRGCNRRPVLVGTLAGFAVLNGVTALSSSYPLTFAARILAGVMGGVLWAMLVGYAARMVPEERRGRAIAIVSAGITVALCAGIPAGAALAAVAGWRAAFGGLAVAAVVLIAWVLWRVPDFPGEPAAARVPLRRVVVLPGVRVALGVTLLTLLGHQAVYTYLAPLAQASGGGPAGLVLLVFGAGTVAGIWAVGAVIDRYARRTLIAALAAVATAMALLGTSGWVPGGAGGVVLAAAGLWGAAFGGVPTLLQTALVDAAGAANADVATSLQTTVYNAGIAAGSLAGGVVLESAGAGALPWTAFPVVAVALTIVVAARRHAFPGRAASARHRDLPGQPAQALRGAVR
ncbi:putative MFS family arabinose efflux permease [Nonomuraea fuscirosea]|uniref:Putative MFS family arabinose efflux permease n=1 Tax=Nonomuraea fuscirosea TaxID=1291556 RepID=A0A2T0MRF8_9ACTN|nr:MFS transporter [Nonomuraea fuscirosea]PRX60812.1 putative MFS family arabinose efflux permease [Nonomuraea fuscirosea]